MPGPIARKLLFFLLPIAAVNLVWVLTGFDVVDRHHYNRGQCRDRGSWVQDRLMDTARNIEVAFIGTSHTWNAVQDSALTWELRQTGAISGEVANLSICGLGRNLHWNAVRELLQYQSPRLIVLELNETEAPHSHDSYPYVARPQDVLVQPVLGNRDYWQDNYQMLMARLHMKQLHWMDGYRGGTRRFSEYGWGAHATIATEADMAPFLSRRKVAGNPAPYPMHFVNRISKLAKANGTGLAFLYLPDYQAQPGPSGAESYHELGPVWIPPDSILSPVSNWMDVHHLNRFGSAGLHPWLRAELSARLEIN